MPEPLRRTQLSNRGPLPPARPPIGDRARRTAAWLIVWLPLLLFSVLLTTIVGFRWSASAANLLGWVALVTIWVTWSYLRRTGRRPQVWAWTEVPWRPMGAAAVAMVAQATILTLLLAPK